MLTPEVGLIFWTTIAFGVLFFILSKYAWKPILKSVNDRESSIKDALDSAEKARMEMENLTADNEKLLKEARAERDGMMKEARELKAKMIADAKEDAKSEADKMIANAQVAIQSEKKAAIADIKSQVASLSIQIAEKVIDKDLKENDNQLRLVESMLDDATLN